MRRASLPCNTPGHGVPVPGGGKQASKVCDNCEQADATLKCDECDELLCDECNYYTHRSQKKKTHRRRFLCESEMVSQHQPPPRQHGQPTSAAGRAAGR